MTRWRYAARAAAVVPVPPGTDRSASYQAAAILSEPARFTMDHSAGHYEATPCGVSVLLASVTFPGHPLTDDVSTFQPRHEQPDDPRRVARA